MFSGRPRRPLIWQRNVVLCLDGGGRATEGTIVVCNDAEVMDPKTMTDLLHLYSHNKTEIRTIEDWRLHREAVNSGWVPGKSAWETANARVGRGRPLVPTDFQALLVSHEATSPLDRHHPLQVEGPVDRRVCLEGRYPTNRSILIQCDARCAKQVAGSVAQRRSDCIVVGWHRLILP